MQKTLSVIDLRAIKSNALNIRSRLGERKFFAVVKADAYGHGAEEVARYLEDIVDAFCVAIIDEGVSLRIAGITKPILVFTPPFGSPDAARALFYNLSVTVNSAETAVLCKDNICHVKVNTGMNRVGCNISELPSVLKVLNPERTEGVYSHLYAADNSDACQKQLDIFNVAEQTVKDFNPSACAHLAASGGLLRGGRYLKDGARCGILLYGYMPCGFRFGGFTPALKVYARRTQSTRFIGGGVGYGNAKRRYGTLSTYRLGYAEGFSRTVPLGENNLCMDSFIRVGGEELQCVMKNADEYAAQCGTISYETLTSVTRRSEKIYVR